MKVLMNHIYELHKGVRHMVLFTCNKKYGKLAVERLESQGIPYVLQPAGQQNLNVQDLTADIVSANQNLILGTSTWGAGELQDDWYDGLKTLQDADLSGKTIAIFGCGDCSSYSDTFVGGMGELYNGIKNSGAKFIGAVETDGYTFDDSEAVIDGKFIGLPLDDINEDDKTDTRIEAWVAAIIPDL